MPRPVHPLFTKFPGPFGVSCTGPDQHVGGSHPADAGTTTVPVAVVASRGSSSTAAAPGPAPAGGAPAPAAAPGLAAGGVPRATTRTARSRVRDRVPTRDSVQVISRTSPARTGA